MYQYLSGSILRQAGRFAGLLLLAGSVDAAERSGEDVYRTVCHYCHEAGIGPTIKARQLPAAYTSHVVRNGLRAMPAFRGTEISDKELARVAAFIEASKGGEQ